MPETTITINRDQRAGFYELVPQSPRQHRGLLDRAGANSRLFQLGYEACEKALPSSTPR